MTGTWLNSLSRLRVCVGPMWPRQAPYFLPCPAHSVVIRRQNVQMCWQRALSSLPDFRLIRPRSDQINRLTEHGQSTKRLELTSQSIQRFILGIDRQPKVLTSEEVDKWLQDPFAQLILKMGVFPLTLNALLKALSDTRDKTPGLSKYLVHHVAEGGQIPWDAQTAKLNRTFRLAIACNMRAANGTVNPDIFVSTGKQSDSTTQFLQLMSWDAVNLGFNFYQRLQNAWIWAGNSSHALGPLSRGRGPFSGHINGNPIMMELKLPWNHWSSMNARISARAFDPNDPFLKSPLFNDSTVFEGGEIFERTIRSATHRWNAARIKMEIKDGVLVNPLYMFRQLLHTTNLNLVSSALATGAITESSVVDIPQTFFANMEAFAAVGIFPEVSSLGTKGSIYLAAAKKFDFALVSGQIKIAGDTFFPFLVPEPALDDIDLFGKMLDREIISQKLAAAMLMVDFSNPIFSPRRKALLKYIPFSIVCGESGKYLDQAFVKNVMASPEGQKDGTPEKEFLDYWNIPEDKWHEVLTTTLEAYFDVIQDKMQTQKGFEEVVMLAESRRFLFKKFAFFEFPLTFVTTNIPNTTFPLEITPDGAVRHVDGVVIDPHGDMDAKR